MVEGYANITIRGVTSTLRIPPLELARLWCQQAGFDVDAEPTGVNGKWKVTARNSGVTISKTGDLREAVSALIEDIQ